MSTSMILYSIHSFWTVLLLTRSFFVCGLSRNLRGDSYFTLNCISFTFQSFVSIGKITWVCLFGHYKNISGFKAWFLVLCNIIVVNKCNTHLVVKFWSMRWKEHLFWLEESSAIRILFFKRNMSSLWVPKTW